MLCITFKLDVFKDIISLATPMPTHKDIPRRQKTHINAVFVMFGDVYYVAKAFTSPSVVADQCKGKRR